MRTARRLSWIQRQAGGTVSLVLNGWGWQVTRATAKYDEVMGRGRTADAALRMAEETLRRSTC